MTWNMCRIGRYRGPWTYQRPGAARFNQVFAPPAMQAATPRTGAAAGAWGRACPTALTGSPLWF
jgi:hypothetical protein